MQQMNFKKIAVYTSFLLASIMASCSKEPEKKQEEKDPNLIELNQYQLKQITLDTAKFEEERAEVSFGGKVSLDNDHAIPVFSFVSGNILKVPVTIGDYVKKGQILAVLRSSDMSNNQTQLDAARVQLQLAKRTLDVAQELFKTKVYSEIDVLTAKAAYVAAEDAVIALETTMKTFGVTDSVGKPRNNIYSVIAPCDGYVVGKNIAEGSSVLEGTNSPLFEISDIKTVWVLFNIFENDIFQVHVGDQVDISTIAYGNKKYNGTISKISNVIDSTAGTLQARVILENQESLLKAGMYTSVNVHVDRHKSSIAIPKECLVYYDNENYVVRLKGNLLFEKRKVEVEGFNSEKAYIKSGINEHDVLVGKGSLYVLGQ